MGEIPPPISLGAEIIMNPILLIVGIMSVWFSEYMQYICYLEAWESISVLCSHREAAGGPPQLNDS